MEKLKPGGNRALINLMKKKMFWQWNHVFLIPQIRKVNQQDHMVVGQSPGSTHIFETLARDQRDVGFPLEVQRSSSDMGTGFLPDFHGLQCDHDTQTKSFIYFKGRELHQVFSLVYLALVSLWCLSTEWPVMRYFSVNHFSAIFFCYNRLVIV